MEGARKAYVQAWDQRKKKEKEEKKRGKNRKKKNVHKVLALMVRFWHALPEDSKRALNRQGLLFMPDEECSPFFRDDYGIRKLLLPYLQGKTFPAEHVDVRQHLEKELSKKEADPFLSKLLRLPKEQLERACVLRAAQPSFRLANPSEMEKLRASLQGDLLKRAESETARTFKMQCPLYLFDGSGSLLMFSLGALFNGGDAEVSELTAKLLRIRGKLSGKTHISAFWKRQGDDLLFALTRVFSECLQLATDGELTPEMCGLLAGLAKDIASYFHSPFFEAVVTALEFCLPCRYFETEWAAGHDAIEALLCSPEACRTLRQGTHRSAERKSDLASLELRRHLTENYADTFLHELCGATFDTVTQAYRLPTNWRERVPIPLVFNAYFGLVTSDTKAQRFEDPTHRDGGNVPGSLSLALYHGRFKGGPLSIDLLQDSRLSLIFQPTCGSVGGFRFDALIHHVSSSKVSGERLTVILFLDRHLNDVAAARKPFAIARDKNKTRSYLQAPTAIDMQTACSASATREDLDSHVASLQMAFRAGPSVIAATAPAPQEPTKKREGSDLESVVALKVRRVDDRSSSTLESTVALHSPPVRQSLSAQFQEAVSKGVKEAGRATSAYRS